MVSGWGDVEGMREDLLKDWGDILERWDGKDRTRPNRVVKLCRKVCGVCMCELKNFFYHFRVLNFTMDDYS